MTFSAATWWKQEMYDVDAAVPITFDNWAGPKGLALVRAWPDGRTDPGWGLVGKGGSDGFMLRYMRGEFNERRVLYGFTRGRWSFAFVMRSMQMVCIDIDGKNGGIEHAKRLGPLPPTLAETSKSGNGFHLYYTTGEDWDDEAGYARFGDRINLEQGVDVRGVGCVYHHEQQRWNRRPPAPLPDHLAELLVHHEQQTLASLSRITKILNSEDDLEVLMLHDELIADLNRPIPQGKRNVTLFAVGTQMAQAGVDDWEMKLSDRGMEVGLDTAEMAKIIGNVQKYATP